MKGSPQFVTEIPVCRVVSRFLSGRFHPKSRWLFPFYFSNITLKTDLLTFLVNDAVFKRAGEMCQLPAYFDNPVYAKIFFPICNSLLLLLGIMISSNLSWVFSINWGLLITWKVAILSETYHQAFLLTIHRNCWATGFSENDKQTTIITPVAHLAYIM